MQTHIHPSSGSAIAGLMLGPGAVLSEKDRYASSNGDWAECPCPGQTLQPNAGATWVRPRAELSAPGQELLGYLASNGFLLVHTTHWKVIPSLGLKNDGRMDWKVKHSEAASELHSLGFVEPTIDDPEVLQVSNVGQAYFQAMCQ